MQYLGVDSKHFTADAPIKSKVHQGIQYEIPLKLREFLSEQYKESIEQLYQRLGNPTIKGW